MAKMPPRRLLVTSGSVGLVCCFLGVSIMANMFLAAIEEIRSKQWRLRVLGADRYVTVQVCIETVANLTLMALDPRPRVSLGFE